MGAVKMKLCIYVLVISILAFTVFSEAVMPDLTEYEEDNQVEKQDSYQQRMIREQALNSRDIMQKASRYRNKTQICPETINEEAIRNKLEKDYGSSLIYTESEIQQFISQCNEGSRFFVKAREVPSRMSECMFHLQDISGQVGDKRIRTLMLIECARREKFGLGKMAMSTTNSESVEIDLGTEEEQDSRFLEGLQEHIRFTEARNSKKVVSAQKLQQEQIIETDDEYVDSSELEESKTEDTVPVIAKIWNGIKRLFS